MRYLFDILHPAHVHVLRHTKTLLEAAGHEVLVTSRVKDVATDLLDGFGIEHTVISQQRAGIANLARELVTRTVRLVRIARERRVDALVGLMGPSIAPAGKLLGMPSFVLYDTEIANRTNRWVYPLATEVITPECYAAPVNGTHVTYPGYHELAYLHPNRFEPARAVLNRFDIDDDPYIVVRLPAFISSHDTKETGTSTERWMDWFDEVGKERTVLVSSERPLPAAMGAYRLEGPPTEIHHVLAYADLVIGESATMATEAAVLGTPAVFIGATSRGYVDDIERRYGLIRRFTPAEFDDAVATADAFLNGTTGDDLETAHDALIADHVDVSAWLANHLESAMNTETAP